MFIPRAAGRALSPTSSLTGSPAEKGHTPRAVQEERAGPWCDLDSLRPCSQSAGTEHPNPGQRPPREQLGLKDQCGSLSSSDSGV